MISEEHIEFPETPITEDTFIKQGWLRVDETEEGDDDEDEGEYTFYYYILPLPRDNPDTECKMLISSCNDEYKEIGLPKGHYFIELENSYGLGLCQSEEQIEILYRALTGQELYED